MPHFETLLSRRETERRRKPAMRALREGLATMADRVRQVVKQAKARIFDGVTQPPGKIVSLFEPHSEIIRKGKASKPTEFGKLVQLTEAENQIVTRYGVFDQRPSDRELLTKAVTEQIQRLGRAPRLVTADAGYYAQTHEQAVEALGVKRVAVPNRNTRSAERKRLERMPWFRKAQAWRTGCEGRISVLKRRHGLLRWEELIPSLNFQLGRDRGATEPPPGNNMDRICGLNLELGLGHPVSSQNLIKTDRDVIKIREVGHVRQTRRGCCGNN